MNYLDLSFPTPQQNLACDEALLDLCEEGLSQEVLRFWTSPNHFVVLGYSNKIRAEVHREFCDSHHIPILRRPSGGGTVLQGPGCLNYALILEIAKRPETRNLKTTTDFIMERHRQAMESLLKTPVSIQGESDLTINQVKFSGNAQRRKKQFLLFHGTFLTGMDLNLVEKCLALPEKQPVYRAQRPHKTFVTNLPIESSVLKHALARTWDAQQALSCPKELDQKIEALVRGQYHLRSWNEKF